MTQLVVRTAQLRYSGADRLDITRKSAGPDGIAFAPTWEILRAVQAAKNSGNTEAYSNAWNVYVTKYTAEMRASYGVTPGSDMHKSLAPAGRIEVDSAIRRGVRVATQSWEALLGREFATLVCYCASPDRCHRRLLAEMLQKLGATYAGETR